MRNSGTKRLLKDEYDEGSLEKVLERQNICSKFALSGSCGECSWNEERVHINIRGFLQKPFHYIISNHKEGEGVQKAYNIGFFFKNFRHKVDCVFKKYYVEQPYMTQPHIFAVVEDFVRKFLNFQDSVTINDICNTMEKLKDIIREDYQKEDGFNIIGICQTLDQKRRSRNQKAHDSATQKLNTIYDLKSCEDMLEIFEDCSSFLESVVDEHVPFNAHLKRCESLFRLQAINILRRNDWTNNIVELRKRRQGFDKDLYDLLEAGFSEGEYREYIKKKKNFNEEDIKKRPKEFNELAIRCSGCGQCLFKGNDVESVSTFELSGHLIVRIYISVKFDKVNRMKRKLRCEEDARENRFGDKPLECVKCLKEVSKDEKEKKLYRREVRVGFWAKYEDGGGKVFLDLVNEKAKRSRVLLVKETKKTTEKEKTKKTTEKEKTKKTTKKEEEEVEGEENEDKKGEENEDKRFGATDYRQRFEKRFGEFGEVLSMLHIRRKWRHIHRFLLETSENKMIEILTKWDSNGSLHFLWVETELKKRSRRIEDLKTKLQDLEKSKEAKKKRKVEEEEERKKKKKEKKKKKTQEKLTNFTKEKEEVRKKKMKLERRKRISKEEKKDGNGESRNRGGGRRKKRKKKRRKEGKKEQLEKSDV